MNSQIQCDKCNHVFATTCNLSRHKLYSCPFNANRTTRPDIIRRTTKRRSNVPKPLSPVDKTASLDKTAPVDPPNANPNTQSLVPIKQTVDPSDNDTTDKALMHEGMKPSEMDELYKMINGIHSRLEDKLNKMESNIESKVESKLSQMVTKLDTTVKAPINTNVFNIEKIQIYMTDSIDFIEVLTKRMGSRKQAVDFIRSKIHQKVEGDVDVFCEIYLHGEPDTWPISCPDKKNHVFRIAQPDSKVINDPGGVQIYKMFKNVYSNTLLRLNNSMIYETLTKIPGTPEYEASRDQLLDSFELGLIQDKAHDLVKAPCDPFIKKLSIKFKSLEKSYELANA